MTPSALRLAALVAALPGVRPVAVEEVADRVGDRFRVGFVEDSQGRRWVVRVPADAVAAAQQQECVELVGLLEHRLPFDVPVPVAAVPLRDGRRAMVHRLIPGRPVSFAGLPAGPGPAERIGEAVAAVHRVDRGLYEEAGIPAYDADECRRRRQADVDLGARTGLVPSGLLARWERMLESVSWWRFAAVPVHGSLRAHHVLLTFTDEADSASGRVQAVTSWEYAHVGDPAEDLAELLDVAEPEAARTVLTAYSRARGESVDAHLRERARLLRELRLLSGLLRARHLDDRPALTQATDALRALDEEVGDTPASGNRTGTVHDRVPVDFDPAPAGEHWYRAGASAAGGESVSAPPVDPHARPRRTGPPAP